ncbi:hypothetical protein LguiB_026453 [Lonicera macranthoides]
MEIEGKGKERRKRRDHGTDPPPPPPPASDTPLPAVPLLSKLSLSYSRVPSLTLVSHGTTSSPLALAHASDAPPPPPAAPLTRSAR